MQPGNPRKGATINNMLSILIDPSAIGNLQEFDEEVSAMIDYIYDSQPATGVEQVLIPGDQREQLWNTGPPEASISMIIVGKIS